MFQVTFIDNNQSVLCEQTLAKFVAKALLFQVRLQNENESVKQEKHTIVDKGST